VVELGAVLMDGSEVEQMRVATVPLRVLVDLDELTEVKLTEVTLNFSDLPDRRITTNEVIRLGPLVLLPVASLVNCTRMALATSVVHCPRFKEMGSFFVGGKISNHSDHTFN
jgi:hypothetical protein